VGFHGRSPVLRYLFHAGLACLTAGASLRPARADELDQRRACVSAFDRAQQLRASTKLRDARDALIECSKETCPALIRGDCTQWMTEVLASLPSVVFGAQDASGKDLVTVRVKIDGVVVQEKLDGKAIPLDPGPHVIRYETTDGRVLEDQVLVREGEKNRSLSANFGQVAPRPTGLAGIQPSSQLEAPSQGSAGRSTSPANFIVGIASAVAGLGALGAALAFDVSATSDANALPCAPSKTCTDSQIAPLRQRYLDADIFLVPGIAAVLFGGVILAVRPFHDGESAKTMASSLRLDAGFSRGGGTAWLRFAW